MAKQLLKHNETTLNSKRLHNFLRYMKTNHWLYLMILPGLVYLILFKYIPMYGVTIAFRDYSLATGFENAKWVGFDHFVNLFSRSAFQRALGNNIIISIGKLLFGFPFPILLSLLINEITSTRLKKVVQTSVILPNFISWVVISGLMFALFSPNSGAIKGVAAFLGYTGDLPNLLTNKESFRSVIIISYIWQAAGMGTIVYLAAISNIDPGLYEAAAIDGAGRWSRMWHITLASLRPTIVMLLIIRLGHVMNAGFDQIFAIQNDLVISVSDIIDTYVYKLGIEQRKFSLAAAAGLFQSAIGMTLVLVTNFIAKKLDSDSGIVK